MKEWKDGKVERGMDLWKGGKMEYWKVLLQEY